LSKSRKRKSSKSRNIGTTLGALALVIAIGALGLGVYQLTLSSNSGPTIYTSEYRQTVELQVGVFNVLIPQINVTYNANAGDRVLLEFSAQIYLDYEGSNVGLSVYFVIDSTYASTSSYMKTASEDLWSTCYMRHFIESSEAGMHSIQIDTVISESLTDSYIKNNVLTVTVY
jgi:hypothetical protein